MLTSASLVKVLRDVTIGSLYAAFLSANGFSLYEVSLLSAVSFAASFFGIFSAAILERFEKRRVILGTGRLLYYLINLVGLSMAPLFIADRTALLVIFLILIFIAGMINSIVNGGYLTWHSNFVKGKSAADYFSAQQISCNLVGTVFLLSLGALVDAYKTGEHAVRIFLIVRAIALVLALIDVAILSLPKEYPYPHTCQVVKIRNLVKIPLGNRKFMTTVGIYCIWLLSMSLSDTIGSYHLQTEVGISLKMLNLYTPLYLIMLVCTSGIWRRFLRRFSWLQTFAIAGLMHAPSAFLTAFVNSENHSWLYLVVLALQAVAGVGLNLADLNMAYVNTPKVDQTYFIGFFTMVTNLANLLGMLVASAVVRLFGSWSVRIADVRFGAMRVVYLLQFAGFLVCCLLFLFKNQQLLPDTADR